MIDCVIIRSICRATLKFLGLCNIFSSLSISSKNKNEYTSRVNLKENI